MVYFPSSTQPVIQRCSTSWVMLIFSLPNPEIISFFLKAIFPTLDSFQVEKISKQKTTCRIIYSEKMKNLARLDSVMERVSGFKMSANSSGIEDAKFNVELSKDVRNRLFLHNWFAYQYRIWFGCLSPLLYLFLEINSWAIWIDTTFHIAFCVKHVGIPQRPLQFFAWQSPFILAGPLGIYIEWIPRPRH